MVAYADSLGEVAVIPTGLFVDRLSGVGGIPRGVITEIFGDESIGKSSLCLQIVASAQRQGFKCIWADVEWSFSPRYAEALGVDNAKLGIVRERFAEDVLDALEAEAESGKWDLIVLDSVGGILPRAEAEKGADGKTIGGQAGIIAKFCRKVVPALFEKKVALVAVNHSFVDIMSGKLMTSGGKKLRYHKSLSIRLKAKQGVSLKQGDRKVGKVVIGEVKKNKLAGTEGMELDGTLVFGTGFSASADLLADAIERKAITKRGAFYFLGAEKLGLGLGKTRELVDGDEALQGRIKDALGAA